ncbi:MAG: hypothetical protein ACI8WB_003992 [Phenylobacterium sp.]|jgi:hypothetical protein
MSLYNVFNIAVLGKRWHECSVALQWLGLNFVVGIINASAVRNRG